MHSFPHFRKIPLDTTSYKLYYVNYEIRLTLGPVDCLCNSAGSLKDFVNNAFPIGWWSVLLGVGLLDFVLEKLLKLVRVRPNNPSPVYK